MGQEFPKQVAGAHMGSLPEFRIQLSSERYLVDDGIKVPQASNRSLRVLLDDGRGLPQARDGQFPGF